MSRFGPPKDPTEGQRWRSGGTTYLWQAGKGWVGEGLYAPPLGRRAEEAAALGLIPPPELEPDPIDPAQVARMAEAEAMMDAAEASSGTVPELEPPPKPAAVINRCACGAAIGAKSTRCRACHSASLRKARPPEPPKQPKFKPDPVEVERVRRAVERIEAPPPPPAAPPIDDTVEVSAPGFKPPPAPLAKKDRPKRVRQGAGIVEVRPLRAAPPESPGGGSSLGDVI
jgi:hypothetical protein